MSGWYEDRVFPQLLHWATRPLYRDRQALIQQASGRVLELGVGTGANFPHYTASANEIHGIEPSPAMLEQARAEAAKCTDAKRFHLLQAGAEALPYPDNHFDTVVACLVFCTIPDANTAATEALRVLHPGGKLLLLEHVAHHRPVWRRTQKVIEPLWTPLACGCHLSRDTGTLLSSAGYDTRNLYHWQHPRLPKFAGYMLSGIAYKA